MKTANHWTTPKTLGNLKITQEALWTVLARVPNARSLDLEAGQTDHDVENLTGSQRTPPQVLKTTTTADVTAMVDDISIIADMRTIPKIP